MINIQDIEPYIQGDIGNRINYTAFSQDTIPNPDEVSYNIRQYVEQQVKEILLIKIQEDVRPDQEERKHLPRYIQNLLRYAEHRGIRLYIFIHHDDSHKILPGAYGGSTLRSNEEYVKQLINEMDKHTSIVKETELNLSDILAYYQPKKT